MKLSVIKAGNKFHPIGEYSEEELNRMVNGQEYIANIVMPRNTKFHRKAFALFKMLFDNQEHFEDFDIYRKWLIMKAGRVISVVAPNGNTMFLPESISFEKMPEDEFEKLFQAIITFAVKEYEHDENTLWQVMDFT